MIPLAVVVGRELLQGLSKIPFTQRNRPSRQSTLRQNQQIQCALVNSGRHLGEVRLLATTS
jgi:hypothetical protein